MDNYLSLLPTSKVHKFVEKLTLQHGLSTWMLFI